MLTCQAASCARAVEPYMPAAITIIGRDRVAIILAGRNRALSFSRPVESAVPRNITTPATIEIKVIGSSSTSAEQITANTGIRKVTVIAREGPISAIRRKCNAQNNGHAPCLQRRRLRRPKPE